MRLERVFEHLFLNGFEMYAVIKTGGKQYKVAKGDVLKLEKIAGEVGKNVVFNDVLALGDEIGKPLVKGASVKAVVVEQKKDEKVIVFKKKRRQNYRRKNGHRQLVTVVRVLDILSGKEPKAEPKAHVEAPAEVKAEAKAEVKAEAPKAKAAPKPAPKEKTAEKSEPKAKAKAAPKADK